MYFCFSIKSKKRDTQKAIKCHFCLPEFVDQMLESESDTLGTADPSSSQTMQDNPGEGSPSEAQGNLGDSFQDSHQGLVNDESCMTEAPSMKKEERTQEERSLMDIIDNLKKEKEPEMYVVTDEGSTPEESNTEGNTSGESPDSERAQEGFMSDPGPDMSFQSSELTEQNSMAMQSRVADFQPLVQLERFANPQSSTGANMVARSPVKKTSLPRSALPSILHFQRKRNLPLNCPGCDKKFRCPADLRKHFLVHSGERNYMCGLCRKGFKLKHHLRSHMLMHIKSCNRVGNEWACVGCGMTASVSQIMLAKHMVNCCGLTSSGSSMRVCNKKSALPTMVPRRMAAPPFTFAEPQTSNLMHSLPTVSLPAISLPSSSLGSMTLPSISLPPVSYSSIPVSVPFSFQTQSTFPSRVTLPGHFSHALSPSFNASATTVQSPSLASGSVSTLKSAPAAGNVNGVYSQPAVTSPPTTLRHRNPSRHQELENRSSTIISITPQTAVNSLTHSVERRRGSLQPESRIPCHDVVEIPDSPPQSQVHSVQAKTPPGDYRQHNLEQVKDSCAKMNEKEAESVKFTEEAKCDIKSVTENLKDACSQTDATDKTGSELSVIAPFCCEPCGLHFEENAMFMIHKTLHGPDSDLQCSQCRQHFQDKYTFMGHLLNKFSH